MTETLPPPLQLKVPVPPPRIRPGQRKARQHIAKAAPIDPPAGAHPLHPNLGALEDSRPHTRVHWCIPVHGAAYIQGLPDSHQPASARALSATQDADTSAAPADLAWTHADLLELWTLLKRMQVLQRFGPMGLAVAPPSPDPFRPAPSPLPPHHRDGPEDAAADPAGRPERLEIGTQIRLYCDLEWARRVRTALSVFPFPLRAAAAGDGDLGAAADEKHATRRLLHGARLTLVGDMGEVLTVI